MFRTTQVRAVAWLCAVISALAGSGCPYVDTKDSFRRAKTEAGLTQLATALELRRLDAELDLRNHGGSFRDMLPQEDYKPYYEESCFEMVVDGKDAWGRELVYSMDEDDTMLLQSVGRNGVDEAGAGDDIQVRVGFLRVDQQSGPGSESSPQ